MVMANGKRWRRGMKVTLELHLNKLENMTKCLKLCMLWYFNAVRYVVVIVVCVSVVSGLLLVRRCA